MLNVAYNALCGGRTLDDIELRRRDQVFLDGIGAKSVPDPTTAGDFCRRFSPASVMALQEAVNRARLGAWAAQPASFFAQTAVIDADASIVPTEAETKEGMNIAYNGVWGYSALMVSFANTKEPLYFKLAGANRPSHEGVVPLYDRSIALCRQAGFADVLLRGDTDFSLTAEFDRWDKQGVRFVFGYDARANLVERAEATPDELYHELAARAERAIRTSPRSKPANVKDAVVRARGYKALRQKAEDVVEFNYRPGNCGRDYRVVALRKDISVEKGDNVLFSEYRFFFYITNDWEMTAHQVVAEARSRCNQENLIAQLKGQVRALHAPVNTLVANWAYMVMAALAWSIKAWCALLLPVQPALGEGAQRATATPLDDGLPQLLGRLYRDPLPDGQRSSAGPLAGHGLEPVARDLLQARRRPLSTKPAGVPSPLGPPPGTCAPKTPVATAGTTRTAPSVTSRRPQERRAQPSARLQITRRGRQGPLRPSVSYRTLVLGLMRLPCAFPRCGDRRDR